MSTVLYDSPGPRARRREQWASAVVILLLLALAAAVLVQLGSRGVLDAERWAVFYDPPRGQEASVVWHAILVRGLGATLRAALYAAPLALVLGLVLAMWRTARNRWVRMPAVVVVELFRGLPVLLMMFFGVLGLGWSIFAGVVFGLVVYNMAIIAEILRAGLASLPKGQTEAAYAIGLTRWQTLLLVQLPQAVRTMLPSIVSQLVVLLKDSSLGFIVGYVELLRTIQNLRDYFGGAYIFPLFFVGAAVFILVNFTLSRVAVWLERRTAAKGRTAAPPPDPSTAPLAAGAAGSTA